MLGQTSVGMYVAYTFMYLFLLIVIVMTARLAILASLLWIVPVRMMLRRIFRRTT